MLVLEWDAGCPRYLDFEEKNVGMLSAKGGQHSVLENGELAYFRGLSLLFDAVCVRKHTSSHGDDRKHRHQHLFEDTPRFTSGKCPEFVQEAVDLCENLCVFKVGTEYKVGRDALLHQYTVLAKLLAKESSHGQISAENLNDLRIWWWKVDPAWQEDLARAELLLKSRHGVEGEEVAEVAGASSSSSAAPKKKAKTASSEADKEKMLRSATWARF